MNTNRTITFQNEESLAKFISELIPQSTVNFSVTEQVNGTFLMTFGGF